MISASRRIFNVATAATDSDSSVEMDCLSTNVTSALLRLECSIDCISFCCIMAITRTNFVSTKCNWVSGSPTNKMSVHFLTQVYPQN